jgi:RNA polymerase sigma factor (sigma-70 family)
MNKQNRSGETITKELLHELLPVIYDAEATEDARSTRMAERAKKRLYEAAYPLIVDISRKEYERRKQWNSMSTMDDLIQDGSIGFFKALNGFNLDAMGASATHYLGQWILVTMRRGAESFDHDFQVGHDQGQKFRKIRAIRGRLVNENGVEPSDTEIVSASQTHGNEFSGAYLGSKNRPVSVAGVSLADISEERLYRQRFGSIERLDVENNYEDGSPGIQVASTGIDPGDQVAEWDASGQLQTLVTACLHVMNVSDVDRDIICRHYGLAPYSESASLRAISRDLNVSRDRISTIIRRFNDTIKAPGGVLYQLLNRMTSDDRDALGVMWLWEQLLPITHQDSSLADSSSKETSS